MAAVDNVVVSSFTVISPPLAERTPDVMLKLVPTFIPPKSFAVAAGKT